MTNEVHKILLEIEHLNSKNKFEILEKLVILIKTGIRKKSAYKCSLLDLEGLGRELWKNVDIRKYINTERDSWN